MNGGFPFDLPLLQPYFIGEGCRRPEDLRHTPVSDARIRYERVKRLLESVAGVPEAVARAVIPGDAVIREFIGGSTIKIPHNE